MSNHQIENHLTRQILHSREYQLCKARRKEKESQARYEKNAWLGIAIFFLISSVWSTGYALSHGELKVTAPDYATLNARVVLL